MNIPTTRAIPNEAKVAGVKSLFRSEIKIILPKIIRIIITIVISNVRRNIKMTMFL